MSVAFTFAIYRGEKGGKKKPKTGLLFPVKRSILPPVAVASRPYYGMR